MKRRTVLWAVLFALTLMACDDGSIDTTMIETSLTTTETTSTTVAPTTTVTTQATDLPRPIIEVTFDGEKCSVTGPTSVPARVGQAFVLTNNSGIGARLHVASIHSEATYDGLVSMNEAGDSGPPTVADFLGAEHFSFAPEHYPAVDLADNQSLNVRLLTYGQDAIFVESTALNQIWLCAPLEVTAIEF